MLRVLNVLPGSIAARAGVAAGDRILSLNGEEVHDLIDFRFLSSDESITLAFAKPSGQEMQVTVSKLPDEDLGAELPPLTIRRCRNRCLFCFVDQMPAGCRKSLSVKDDDFRASFLYGNYLTLSSLTDADRERIFRQRLSPLYISVHATDTPLRNFLLGNRRAPDILTELRRLAAGGIRMHTQIVLCPGINDGGHLRKTIEDLAGLAPAVASIAVVPVGLTSHRKGLFPLRSFTKQEARSVLGMVHELGRRFKRSLGTRLVFASDEFFIKAGEMVPPAPFYEDFPQIENGVGMAAEFLSAAKRVKLPSRVPPLRVTIVTGVSAAPLFASVLERFAAVSGLSIRAITVPNRFFGPSVTVTGLLTGRDIVHALKGKRLGDLLIIPANTLKADEDIFLDGMTLSTLEHTLGVPVKTAGTFRELTALLRGGPKAPDAQRRKRT